MHIHLGYIRMRFLSQIKIWNLNNGKYKCCVRACACIYIYIYIYIYLVIVDTLVYNIYVVKFVIFLILKKIVRFICKIGSITLSSIYYYIY